MRIARVLVLLAVWVPLARTQDVELHFVDVGQGDCTLIECPDGSKVLVDCGSSAGGDFAKVRDYVHGELAGDAIDALVVTHPDADHYNWLVDLLAGIEVQRVVVAGTNGEYADFGTWLGTYGGTIDRLEAADFDDYLGAPRLQFGEVALRVLAANVASTNGATNLVSNTRSIVLMLTYGKFRAMLTGDATYETHEVVLDRYPYWWLDTDVLKVGHHGSRTTGFPKADDPKLWPAIVRPEVIVLSASGTQYGHPAKDVVEAFEPYLDPYATHDVKWGYHDGAFQYETVSKTAAVFTTPESGTIRIASDGQEVWVFEAR